MNILDENGESYFVTAFDHSTQEQGTATSKDAFTSGDINASLTQEVVELREEVAGSWYGSTAVPRREGRWVGFG